MSKNGRKIKGYNTTYKRIEWDKPAPTITMCNGGISSQNNVHPGRLQKDGTYSDARVLTLRELFILDPRINPSHTFIYEDTPYWDSHCLNKDVPAITNQYDNKFLNDVIKYNEKQKDTHKE